MENQRLAQQLQFIVEIDKLKTVLRQTLLIDSSRRENSAEHSWHLAIMAIALAEYAPEPINVNRVIYMVLLHDIVEIDAGDTFCYDTKGYEDKAERENQAAERIFGLLPDDQAPIFRAIWEEFEAGETADARFAKALDCLQPFLHNYHTEGGTWKLHNIHHGQVLTRMQAVKEGLPGVWPTIEQLIAISIEKGFLRSLQIDPLKSLV